MKFLEAQRLAAQQNTEKDSGEKIAAPHTNKMMGGAPQNKSHPIGGKQRSSETKKQPYATDDAIALSKSLGIDLSAVTGTGSNGSILPVDVRKFAEIQKTKSSPPTE